MRQWVDKSDIWYKWILLRFPLDIALPLAYDDAMINSRPSNDCDAPMTDQPIFDCFDALDAIDRMIDLANRIDIALTPLPEYAALDPDHAESFCNQLASDILDNHPAI